MDRFIDGGYEDMEDWLPEDEILYPLDKEDYDSQTRALQGLDDYYLYDGSQAEW